MTKFLALILLGTSASLMADPGITIEIDVFIDQIGGTPGKETIGWLCK